jgi:hypothetical protein
MNQSYNKSLTLCFFLNSWETEASLKIKKTMNERMSISVDEKAKHEGKKILEKRFHMNEWVKQLTVDEKAKKKG